MTRHSSLLDGPEIFEAKSFLEFPKREPDFRIKGDIAVVKHFLVNHAQEAGLKRAKFIIFKDGPVWNVWRDAVEVSYGLPHKPYFDMGKNRRRN